MNVQIAHENFGHVVAFALRYALGRQSTAPSIVQEFIRDNLDVLSPEEISLLILDIDECRDFGSDVDKAMWLRFRETLQHKLHPPVTKMVVYGKKSEDGVPHARLLTVRGHRNAIALHLNVYPQDSLLEEFEAYSWGQAMTYYQAKYFNRVYTPDCTDVWEPFSTLSEIPPQEVKSAQDAHEKSEIIQWCRDANGNRLEIGDTVESCDDGEGGVILDLIPDGSALVKWESGLETTYSCPGLVLI